ncbi:MAG: methylamine dehydrogenase light chain [Steroidobacteraceae bacterium]
MSRYDALIEHLTRNLAGTAGRRSFLRTLGHVLIGAGALPLLPVARGQAAGNDEQNPQSCDYWRYCAVDGFLCACCGGTDTICPPGTEPAPMTWVGTCLNPADGRHYIVSYNDCCGKSSCGRCLCARNEGDRPLYMAGKSNDYNWCVGSKSDIPYHCTMSRVINVVEQ